MAVRRMLAANAVAVIRGSAQFLALRGGGHGGKRTPPTECANGSAGQSHRPSTRSQKLQTLRDQSRSIAITSVPAWKSVAI